MPLKNHAPNANRLPAPTISLC